MRKRELVALLLLSFECLVTVNVLWLFLTVPWIGLQCVIEVLTDHTHVLLFHVNCVSVGVNMNIMTNLVSLSIDILKMSSAAKSLVILFCYLCRFVFLGIF